MKWLMACSVAALSLAIASGHLVAQESQRISYRATVYVNVAADKQTAMIDNAKEAGAKLIQERIAAGEQITSWTVGQIAYRGTPALDYNFFVSTTFAGTPTAVNPATRDQVYRKATGLTFQEYTAKIQAIGTNVGSVLYRVEASNGSPTAEEGNYINVVRWKVTPLRGADYGRFVQTRLLPLNAQAIKDARELGWSRRASCRPGALTRCSMR